MKSTKSRRPAKSVDTRRNTVAIRPEKPHADFPLFPHASGRWAKKINHELYYFGRWGHKQGARIVPVEDVEKSAADALQEFNRQWPYIREGRTAPPADADEGCTIKLLVTAFPNSKRTRLNSGELSQRSFADYVKTGTMLADHFGRSRRVDDLRADDFEGLRAKLALRLGPVSLKNEINRVRVVLKFASDQRLIPHPVSYGQSFNRASAKVLRRNRNAGGPRMFEAAELRTFRFGDLDHFVGSIEVHRSRNVAISNRHEYGFGPLDSLRSFALKFDLNVDIGHPDANAGIVLCTKGTGSE